MTQLQVLSRIHPLVQNADYVHAVSTLDVEDEMTADAVATVSLTNVITGPSASRINSNALDRCADLGYIDLSLILIPALLSEVPDR